MFIIFGTSTRYINDKKGVFVCPGCQTLKKYCSKTIQSWFTLFFIPVFPIGGKNDPHVECQECKKTYYPDVLENNQYNLDGTTINMKENKARV